MSGGSDAEGVNIVEIVGAAGARLAEDPVEATLDLGGLSMRLLTAVSGVLHLADSEDDIAAGGNLGQHTFVVDTRVEAGAVGPDEDRHSAAAGVGVGHVLRVVDDEVWEFGVLDGDGLEQTGAAVVDEFSLEDLGGGG